MKFSESLQPLCRKNWSTPDILLYVSLNLCCLFFTSLPVSCRHYFYESVFEFIGSIFILVHFRGVPITDPFLGWLVSLQVQSRHPSVRHVWRPILLPSDPRQAIPPCRTPGGRCFHRWPPGFLRNKRNSEYLLRTSSNHYILICPGKYFAWTVLTLDSQL